jgi:hypothetical protein
VLSAERLLEHATTYPGIFSPNAHPALAVRKICRGLTPLQAAEYVATAFAPTTADFDSLSQELEVHRSLYESTIGKIRTMSPHIVADYRGGDALLVWILASTLRLARPGEPLSLKFNQPQYVPS